MGLFLPVNRCTVDALVHFEFDPLCHDLNYLRVVRVIHVRVVQECVVLWILFVDVVVLCIGLVGCELGLSYCVFALSFVDSVESLFFYYA